MKSDKFDFLDYYYNVLRSNQERAYFRELICKKLNTTTGVFYKWINRASVPGHAQIHIQDIINDEKYELPDYK